MKVLVVGGAGYIGSHCVYELIRDNHEVVVFDNLSNGNIEAVHPNAKLVIGDIHDSEALDSVMQSERFDVLIQFAAFIVVSESVREPIKYYKNNVMGVLNVLEAMQRNGLKNIVFSSTAAVYGNPKDVPCTEETLTSPESPYGETKLASEKMIKWVCNQYDMNYVIFRYFNVAGADYSGNIGLASKNITHIIPSAIETYIGIRPKLTVFGDDFPTKDGTCVRDYIHVSDLALAHIKGAEYLINEKKSNLFNLGTGDGYSVKEIVKAVLEECGDFTYEIGERRDGDPAIIVASNDKAQKILGWTPKYSLKEMVRSDYQWRLKNPNGYKKGG